MLLSICTRLLSYTREKIEASDLRFLTCTQFKLFGLAYPGITADLFETRCLTTIDTLQSLALQSVYLFVKGT